MADISLFWDTNIDAMTSCKNTLLCLKAYSSVFEKRNEHLLHFMVLDICSGVCNACTDMRRKCGSTHKLLILLYVNSCYCFGARRVSMGWRGGRGGGSFDD